MCKALFVAENKSKGTNPCGWVWGEGRANLMEEPDDKQVVTATAMKLEGGLVRRPLQEHTVHVRSSQDVCSNIGLQFKKQMCGISRHLQNHIPKASL